jgi:hypothetical protein
MRDVSIAKAGRSKSLLLACKIQNSKSSAGGLGPDSEFSDATKLLGRISGRATSGARYHKGLAQADRLELDFVVCQSSTQGLVKISVSYD